MRDTPEPAAGGRPRIEAELLRRFWALDGAEVTPLGGGMNSETRLVEHEG
jgi:hypothetical protein